MIQQLGDVPARVLPYATATALTKAAKRGQLAVVAQMRSSFDKPVAYTLNSTRIEVATKDKLFARIAVKDRDNGGARPTSYLLPEVEGGIRSEKGVERALRAKGLLQPGEWAYPQSGSIMDANGNVSGTKVRSVLAQLGRGSSSKYFVGAVGKNRTRGLWERGDHQGGRTGKNQKRSVRAIFVFSTATPTYTPRLDFVGAAASSVRDGFASDFYAAAKTLQRKFA